MRKLFIRIVIIGSTFTIMANTIHNHNSFERETELRLIVDQLQGDINRLEKIIEANGLILAQ